VERPEQPPFLFRTGGDQFHRLARHTRRARVIGGHINGFTILADNKYPRVDLRMAAVQTSSTVSPKRPFMTET
jgi:hypothetical protein